MEDSRLLEYDAVYIGIHVPRYGGLYCLHFQSSPKEKLTTAKLRTTTYYRRTKFRTSIFPELYMVCE